MQMEKFKPDGVSAEVVWPKLISGTLIKRYNRFLADVKLRNHRIVTAHCPNSGSMKACSEPGRTVHLSRHNNPKRKLKYTWELIEMPTSLVGVNTMVPNRLVHNSIQSSKVKELMGYERVVREVAVGKGSRLDLRLEKNGTPPCYVEVKNCTLVEYGVASFPDAVTSRGLKHLRELQKLHGQGCRCAMFFLIQRMDVKRFKPADHIDPDYGKGLRKAAKKGVEIIVYDTKIDLKGIRLNRQIPYFLE
jgi:sugar fermentation stimulation protein A